MSFGLNVARRAAATGLCYLAFGAGSLVLRVMVFPVVRFGVHPVQRRCELARDLIRHSFALFVFLMCRVGVMTLEVRGAQRLQRRGLLLLSNHPTLVDVVILMSMTRNADCVVKAALLRNPFTRGPVSTAGFICNDHGPDIVELAAESLRRGGNLIVFPEGTRTRPGQPMRMHRGAANIAVRAGADVTPVVIRCDMPFLVKGMPWWQFPLRRANFIVEVQPDLPVAPFLDGLSPAVAARRLTAHLADLFAKELEDAAAAA